MHGPAFATVVFFAIASATIGIASILSALGDTQKVRRRSAVTTAITGCWVGVIAALWLGGPQVISTIIACIIIGACVFGWVLGGGRG